MINLHCKLDNDYGIFLKIELELNSCKRRKKDQMVTLEGFILAILQEIAMIQMHLQL